jgi:WD40 repeat protein
VTAATALTQLDGENPWPGLDAFEEDARGFFHGRDREAQELLRHVLAAPITVLYGRSGLGKTSLLRAGLFPLLRERHFLPIYVRFDLEAAAPPPSRQLHQFVRDAVAADAPDAILPSEEESVWEYLHRADLELWDARNYPLTPVIVLDQFEELLRLGERVPDPVRAFMNDLGDLAENRIPAELAARIDNDEAVARQFRLPSHNYKLLISLREDFLPHLEGWQRRIPTLGRSRMRLLPLRAGDALDAVHKPAAHLMTDALARRVVGIIAGKGLHRGRDTAQADVDHPGDNLGVLDVDPAVLSLFCRELNELRKRRGQPHFDERLVEDAKDTTLPNYYSSCVRYMPERVADFIESELIIGGFRRPYPRERAVPSLLTDDELNQLISSRLLRIVDHNGAPWIELTHDVLEPSVREHRDRRRAEKEKAELAACAEQEQQAARKLAAEEAERQVAREKEKRSRILRVLLAVTAVLLAFTAVIAVVAVVGFRNATVARSEAQERFRSATSVRLVSEALAILDGARPGGDVRALQQLLAARSLDPGRDEGALYSAVVKTLTTRRIIETPDAPSSVALSPDGHRIASVDAKLIRLRDADTGQPIGQPIRSTQGLTGVVFSPDGHNLAACDASGTVTSWNADTGQPIGQPTGRQHSVTAVAFGPDGRRLAVVTDHMISLWDVDTGRPLPGLPIKTSDAVTSVGVSLDGRRVATGNEAGTIQLWDADSGAPIGGPLTGHTDAVTGVAFSFDGHQLASGGADDTIRLWNPDTGQPIGGPLTGHTNVVTSVAFGADGQLVSSGADHTIRLWDLARGLPLAGHTDVVTSVAFGPDGHRIASASLDDTIRLWDVIRGAPIGAPLIGHQGGITSVTLGFDGHRIASGGVDGTVRFFDTDTGLPIGLPLLGHTDIVNSVSSSQNGRRIVSGSADGTIRLWDAETGAPIGEPLTGHTAPVFSVAFSPDGHRIASGSADGTIRLWDAETRKPIGPPLTGHTGNVISVAFSPDGHRLASASTDRTIRLWNPFTGQPIGQPLSGSDLGPVESVAFSPDGRQLASGSANFATRLWDTNTGQQIGDPLRGQRGAIDGLAFSPDGQRLASASADQTIRLWPTVASPNDLCHKLTANMSHRQWHDWVSPDIPYIATCPGLPIAPD